MDKRIYSIYKLTNIITGDVYIGQTCRTLQERLTKHRFNARHSPKWVIHKAMAKYGIENFTIELLETTNDPDSREKHWIATLRPRYNMTEGGQSFVPNEEVRQKISTSKKGVKFTDEHRRRISEALKGHPGAFKGKRFSDDHKRKMSKAKLGRKFSDEHRQAMAEAQKRRRLRERLAYQGELDPSESQN